MRAIHPYLFFTMILSMTFTNLGCGAIKSKPKKSFPQAQQLFVHGDPLNLIENTTRNEQSFFEAANLSDFDNFSLASLILFQNISSVESENEDESQDEQDIEKENAPTEDLTHEKFDSYAFAEENGRFVYKVKHPANTGIELNFVNHGGFLQLQSFFNVELKPLHYSLSSAKDAFSILFEMSEGNKKFLGAIYFTRIYKDAAIPQKKDTKFAYIRGPGVNTAWSGDINLDLCNVKDSDFFQKIFTDGALAWTKFSKIGSRKFTYSIKQEPKPFSDLNQQCMILVNDFLFENVDDAAITGLTMPIVDASRQMILGGSIFISKKGLMKVYASMKPTVIHEIGHFLGLDHEFRRNSDGKYTYPSIMSYGNETAVTEHDRAAIEQLYGAYPTAQEPSPSAPSKAP